MARVGLLLAWILVCFPAGQARAATQVRPGAASWTWRPRRLSWCLCMAARPEHFSWPYNQSGCTEGIDDCQESGCTHSQVDFREGPAQTTMGTIRCRSTEEFHSSKETVCRRYSQVGAGAATGRRTRQSSSRENEDGCAARCGSPTPGRTQLGRRRARMESSYGRRFYGRRAGRLSSGSISGCRAFWRTNYLFGYCCAPRRTTPYGSGCYVPAGASWPTRTSTGLQPDVSCCYKGRSVHDQPHFWGWSESSTCCCPSGAGRRRGDCTYCCPCRFDQWTSCHAAERTQQLPEDTGAGEGSTSWRGTFSCRQACTEARRTSSSTLQATRPPGACAGLADRRRRWAATEADAPVRAGRRRRRRPVGSSVPGSFRSWLTMCCLMLPHHKRICLDLMSLDGPGAVTALGQSPSSLPIGLTEGRCICVVGARKHLVMLCTVSSSFLYSILGCFVLKPARPPPFLDFCLPCRSHVRSLDLRAFFSPFSTTPFDLGSWECSFFTISGSPWSSSFRRCAQKAYRWLWDACPSPSLCVFFQRDAYLLLPSRPSLGVLSSRFPRLGSWPVLTSAPAYPLLFSSSGVINRGAKQWYRWLWDHGPIDRSSVVSPREAELASFRFLHSLAAWLVPFARGLLGSFALMVLALLLSPLRRIGRSFPCPVRLP